MSINVTREGTIATVALDRPQARNAITMAMRADFSDAFATLDRDRSVRAVILTGTGDHFCSGADVREMGDISPEDFVGRMRALHRMVRAVSLFRAPVVTAVDGVCIGAAWGLALATDLILVSDRARFAATFRRIGYAPDAGLAWQLPRAAGAMRAREILYSGRTINADEAVRLGLALDAVPADALLDRARALARDIADGPATALSLTRRQLRAAADMSLESFLEVEASMQPLLGQTGDHREAVAAFRAKRPPVFRAD